MMWKKTVQCHLLEGTTGPWTKTDWKWKNEINFLVKDMYCVHRFKGQFHLKIQIVIYYSVMFDTFHVWFYGNIESFHLRGDEILLFQGISVCFIVEHCKHVRWWVQTDTLKLQILGCVNRTGLLPNIFKTAVPFSI